MSERQQVNPEIADPRISANKYGELVNAILICQSLDGAKSDAERAGIIQCMTGSLNELIMTLEQSIPSIPTGYEKVRDSMQKILDKAKLLRLDIENGKVDSTSADSLHDHYRWALIDLKKKSSGS